MGHRSLEGCPEEGRPGALSKVLDANFYENGCRRGSRIFIKSNLSAAVRPQKINEKNKVLRSGQKGRINRTLGVRGRFSVPKTSAAPRRVHGVFRLGRIKAGNTVPPKPPGAPKSTPSQPRVESLCDFGSLFFGIIFWHRFLDPRFAIFSDLGPIWAPIWAPFWHGFP